MDMSILQVARIVLPITAVAMVGVLLVVGLIRYFAPATRLGMKLTKIEMLEPEASPGSLRLGQVWLRIAVWTLLSRAFLLLAAGLFAYFTGEWENMAAHPDWFFVRWDAHHYLGIAENGYVNTGDARFHIVFYPLYPWAVRLIRPLFAGNTTAAALTLSNLCLPACGYLLYRIIRDEQGERAAWRGVKFFIFGPISMFFAMPYSESLFMLMTLLSVYFARKRRMAPAILFGALSALARVLGLAVAVSVFYEFLEMAREKRREGARFTGPRVAGYALATALIGAGFLVYLGVNWSVTGNPFQFLIYQSEHWSQNFGSLRNTVAYTFENMMTYDNVGLRLSIWGPQLLMILGVLMLLLFTVRRNHPADGAYMLIYTYIAVSPTWLLSGPRYLLAMYALYPILARITKGRVKDAVFTGITLLTTLYFIYYFIIKGMMY